MDIKSKRNSVIVVDDDLTTRKLIADYLEDEGYKVETFSTPENIDIQINDCEIVIMDVRFGKDRPYAGIDYIVKKVENKEIDLSTTIIIFISRWGRDRQGVPERLQKINRFEWLDVITGLELTELKEIIRSNIT